MKTIYATDRMVLGKRQVLADGSLVAPDSTLARTGVQKYLAYEFGDNAPEGTKPMDEIRLYRPPEEVFSADSLASFENVPLTDDHPPGNVVNESNKHLKRGKVSGVKQHEQLMKGTVHADDKSLVKKINGGKAELSNGYSFYVDWTPGVAPDGTHYHGVQRNIRGNHVAVVAEGRCGSACRIADSKPNQTQGVNTMSERTVVVDGIPLQVSDQAAAVIDNLTKQRDQARADKATAEAKTSGIKIGDKTFNVDELVKVVGDQANTIATLQKDVMTPAQRDAAVAGWAQMVADGKAMAPSVVIDGKTCHEYRKEVVAAVIAGDSTAKAVVTATLAGVELAAADEDKVKTAFTVLAATKPSQHQAGDSSAVVNAFAGGDSAAASGAAPTLVGRAAFLSQTHSK